MDRALSAASRADATAQALAPLRNRSTETGLRQKDRGGDSQSQVISPRLKAGDMRLEQQICRGLNLPRRALERRRRCARPDQRIASRIAKHVLRRLREA